MTIDDEILGRKYNLDIDLYRGRAIDFDVLRIRTANCLKNVEIYHLDQLLSLSYSKILEIRNLGMLSLKDIEEYIKALDDKNFGRKNIADNYLLSNIRSRRDMIYNGDFTEKVYEGLTDCEVEIVNKFKKGFDLLDVNLIRFCREKTVSAYAISTMLNDFIRQVEKNAELGILYASVKEKSKNLLKPYFENYPLRADVSVEFATYCEKKEATLNSLFDKTLTGRLPAEEIVTFVKWVAYDLRKELVAFFDSVYSGKSNRIERILKLRAKKYTLQAIGENLGITRERVRQIEKKVVQPFCHWQKEKKFLPRLSADFNGKKILDSTDLQEYFGDDTEVLLYLLQCADDEFFSYDRETDTVILAEDDITDFVRNFVEKMPEEFDAADYYKYRQMALSKHNITADLFHREVIVQYNISGTHYHRNRLSLEKMYQIVLSKYYPDGMNVYDDTELNRFRILLINEFGEVSLPQKNRSISAAIGRCCVLCGRGRYRIKENEKIPHELFTRIYDYIMSSERSLFFMNEIYLEFEDELLEAGIDNRFFLQGLLREKYDKELFFRKDYVSKNSSNLSMYRELKLFIKKSKYPVTKKQIREAYHGITEIMISIALSDDDIINYFGAYIHSSNLKLFEYDKKYFSRILNEILYDGMPHHCNEIFEIIKNDNPDLLNRLGIYYQYSLFSLLQYLYSEQYMFTRPYLAQVGVNINKPFELLQEYVSANDVFEITELLELAKEYHYTIYDILKFLNGWNDTHLLINKQEMGSIEHIGITKDIVCEVERMIENELKDSSLISELECIYRFPNINIPWNEWLVYSVINKWGSEVEVHTTSNQFRLSFPVVSKIWKFDRKDYGDTDSGEMTKTMDLNDMDAVAEYIMNDLNIEW